MAFAVHLTPSAPTRGLVVAQTRVIAGKSYNIGYAGDAADCVWQIIYPSGRIVTYLRGPAGRIYSVTKQTSAAALATNGMRSGSNEPFGELASLTYGNGLALSKSFTGDDARLARLSPCRPASRRDLGHGRGGDHVLRPRRPHRPPGEND